MEILTILLSSLLALVSPVGLILDSRVEKAIRSQVEDVETLEVRIDNVPNYQILRGNIQQVSIASRGLEVRKNLRIDTLEVVTDPLHLDLQGLRQRENVDFREFLSAPLQGGVRLVLTETDINNTLQSAEVRERFQDFLNRAMSPQAASNRPRYQLLNPRIELLGNNRLSFQAQLRRVVAEGEEVRSLDLMIESGLKILGGNRLELVALVGSINNKPLSAQLLTRLAESANQALDLKRLENKGITARILQLSLENEQLNLAAFIRLDNQLKTDNIHQQQ